MTLKTGLAKAQAEHSREHCLLSLLGMGQILSLFLKTFSSLQLAFENKLLIEVSFFFTVLSLCPLEVLVTK